MIYPISDYIKQAAPANALLLAQQSMRELEHELKDLIADKARLESNVGIEEPELQKLIGLYEKISGDLSGISLEDIVNTLNNIRAVLRNLSNPKTINIKELRPITQAVSARLRELSAKYKSPAPDTEDEYYKDNLIYSAMRDVRNILENPIKNVIKPRMVWTPKIKFNVSKLERKIVSKRAELDSAILEVSKIKESLLKTHSEEFRVYNSKVEKALHDARSKNQFFDDEYQEENETLSMETLNGSDVAIGYYPRKLVVFTRANFALKLKVPGGEQAIPGWGNKIEWLDEDITNVVDDGQKTRFTVDRKNYVTPSIGFVLSPGNHLPTNLSAAINDRFTRNRKEIFQGARMRMAVSKMDDLSTELRKLGAHRVKLTTERTALAVDVSFQYGGKKNTASVQGLNDLFLLTASNGRTTKKKESVDLSDAIPWFLKTFEIISKMRAPKPGTAATPDDVKNEAENLRSRFRVNKKNAIIAAILITVITTTSVGALVYRKNIARFFRRSSSLFTLVLNGLKEQGWLPGKKLTPAQKFYLIKLVEGLDQEEARQLTAEYKRMLPRYK